MRRKVRVSHHGPPESSESRLKCFFLNAKKNSLTAHSLHPKILGTTKCELSKHINHDRLIPERSPTCHMSFRHLSGAPQHLATPSLQQERLPRYGNFISESYVTVTTEDLRVSVLPYEKRS
jgi:hypothetical protein